MLKFLVSAGTAIALATAPTVVAAQAQPAPASKASEVQPADEQAEGSELRTGFILPLVAIVAVVVLIYLVTRKKGDEAFPTSP
jgi:hypothetical protein